MSDEHLGQTNNSVEKRKGQIRSWSDLKSYIPQDVKPEHINFLQTYFRVQLKISEGRREKAKEIMNGLAKKTGFVEFERQNPQLFAAIDVVVRGSTNRLLGDEKPAFKVK